MDSQDLVNVFFAGRFIVFGIWGFLFGVLCWNLFTKNFTKLKINFLFLLNTTVFILIWGYVVGIHIVVGGVGGSTREEAYSNLLDRIKGFFADQLWYTSMFVAGITLVNFLYLRFVVNQNPKLLTVRLAIANILLLIVGSLFGCYSYYQSFRPEIEGRFAHLESNWTINNIAVRSDSTLELTINNSGQEWISKPLSHLIDTTFVSGNAVIFLHPDSSRWESLWSSKTPGFEGADSDFSMTTSLTLNDIDDDKTKFKGIAGSITERRYVYLTDCIGCPMLIDRDTINYGIIYTGSNRIPLIVDSCNHFYCHIREVKDYFELK